MRIRPPRCQGSPYSFLVQENEFNDSEKPDGLRFVRGAEIQGSGTSPFDGIDCRSCSTMPVLPLSTRKRRYFVIGFKVRNKSAYNTAIPSANSKGRAKP